MYLLLQGAGEKLLIYNYNENEDYIKDIGGGQGD
jgi:hypothetical protein